MCITPESLALERSGRTVPFHNFIVEYKKNSNTIYYFVEGKDDPHFYNRAIDYEIPVDWNKKYYIACGQDKVLDLHSRLAGTINKHQVLFFIDRDLSELLDEELPQFDNLYITDDYSIENSICNNRTLENVLNEVFSFHNAQSADWDKIFSLYNETYEKFLMIIIPIMAYILFLRKNEKALNAKLNLKNFSIKDLFEINDDFTLKDKKESNEEKYLLLEKNCNINSGCRKNYKEDYWLEEFSKLEKKDRHIRGKFISYFFACFCQKIYKQCDNIVGHSNINPKCSQTFSEKDPLCVIAPRCNIPETLRDFLRKNMTTYQSIIDTLR